MIGSLKTEEIEQFFCMSLRRVLNFSVGSYAEERFLPGNGEVYYVLYCHDSYGFGTRGHARLLSSTVSIFGEWGRMTDAVWLFL